MKKIIALCMLAFVGQAQAQTTLLNHQEEQLLISGVMTNVVSTMLKGDLEQIEKSWVSFAKEQLQQKMENNENIFIATKIVVNQITDKRGDLIVYIYNKDNEVAFNMAFRLGYDVYLNSEQYEVEYAKMEEFLNYFVYNYYNDFLPRYIKSKKKSLKVLGKEMKKAKKSSAKAAKQNRKGTKKIAKNEGKAVKYQLRVEESQDNPEKRIKYTQKLKDIEIANKKRSDGMSYNNELLRINAELVEALEPKILVATDEMTAARLTLIEVQSKMKTFK